MEHEPSAKVLNQITDLGHQTPFFIYDLSVIGSQAQKIQQAFGSYPNFELLYAIKANNNPQVLEFLTAQGLGLHVSTLGEAQLASQFSNRISFTGPILKPDLLEFAKAHGVINVNSLEELQRLADWGNLGVRVNPGVGWSFLKDHAAGEASSQFGVLPEELLNLTQEQKDRVTRLHMHTNSDSYEIDIFLKGVQILLDTAAEITTVEAVNIGGGLAVPIGEYEGEFDIHSYATQVIDKFKDFQERNGRSLKLQMEPGSYLVRPAGFYVAKIFGEAERNGIHYYYSDGSNHHLRGLLSNRTLLTPNSDQPEVLGEVFGSTCQRGDILIPRSPIPQLQYGDLVVIPNTGAYCSVQSDNFNLVGIPEEVIIS